MNASCSVGISASRCLLRSTVFRSADLRGAPGSRSPGRTCATASRPRSRARDRASSCGTSGRARRPNRPLPMRLGNLAVGEIVRDRRAEERELPFHHRDVDLLAFAGPVFHPQREHDRVGAVHAGGHVGDRYAGARAVRARLAGDADHAALGLEDEIERRALAIRPVLPEPRYRAVDDPGIALASRPRNRAPAASSASTR